MKHKIVSLVVLAVLFCSCDGMHEFTEKYYGEIVYPAKYDTIVGSIGYERVEIDLLRAGRIPSEQIKMGKAKKTVIEYDDEQIVIDKLVSWVTITDLTQSKIYRFYVYTMDEFDNKSVPQEIALIPFTKSDLESLVITSPRITTSPSSAVVEWPNGANSVLMDYHGLSYEYTDKDGQRITGERGANPRFYVGNLEAGASYSVNMKYKVLPIVSNQHILDTLVMERSLSLTIPISTGTFSPAERDILTANGLATFDFGASSKLTKLIYPLHANSLQDIFYFPNLKELDLTGGSLFDCKTYRYDNRGVQSEIGGGQWLPFIAKVSSVGDVQALNDLLESGSIERVRYIPNSMGLDDLLAPYVESGLVELVDLPDEILISDNYFVDGLVQDGNWEMAVTYNPGSYPTGSGLQNVYKMIPKKRSSTFVIAVPPEYKFNAAEYPYFKYRIYAPFQRIWLRFMNNMWAFSGNSNYGQEYWDYGNPTHYINDGDLQKWTDYSIDISNMITKHTRVIVFNIGGEPGPDPDSDIEFYISNIRFSKEK